MSMKGRSAVFVTAMIWALLGVCLASHGAVQVKGETVSQLQPVSMPEMIYVADFDLGSADVKESKGVVGGGGPLKRGVLNREGGILNREGGVLNRQESPADTARRLVDKLSESLVKELTAHSLPATRTFAGQTGPKKGWLVRGQFVEVDKGNRIQRAVIGFGQGATHMEVQANVTNLNTYPDTPFLLFGTEAGSGKKPGAVVTLNPYVAAAKFVMTKNATDKDVEHTGAEISAEIIKYMEGRGLLQKEQ
jgi:hypothetical protein